MEIKMKSGLIIIILAFFFGFAGWYLGISSSEQPSSPTVISAEDSHRISELEQQIAGMKKNIAALKEKQTFSSQTESVANTSKRSDLPVMGSDNSTVNVSDNTVSQNTKLQSTPSSDAGPVSAITSLPQKFATEGVNTEWALDHQQKLQEVLYKDVQFQSKELESIACKSTTCEVKIKIDKKEDLMKVGSALNRLLMIKQPGVFDPNMMIKYSESEKTGSFYFGAIN